VKVEEKAICEKASDLWAQAVDEGYNETYGITIDAFKGAHYAIGALKGFWTPSESGFVVINQAIADLEQLLSDEEDENELVSSTEEPREQMQKEERPLKPALDELPDSRVKWRITRKDDGEGSYIYTTFGVNDYSFRKYYQEKNPGELIDFEDRRVLPEEVPLDASFEDDNIGDALSFWIHDHFSFELVREISQPFQAVIEINHDENELLVWDITGRYPTTEMYDLSEDELIEVINELLDYFDNFRLIFTGSAQ
jgi:hypothetical protein